MLIRLWLLRGAAALMSFGALLAGLAGHGWTMVPAVVAVFVLGSVILRPHLWPASLRDLGTVDAVVALAALVATQALLVILCFGFGRGIGGVMGLRPSLPAYLPLALALVAMPLSRLVWNPRVMADHAGFDPLLHDVVPGPEQTDRSATGQQPPS